MTMFIDFPERDDWSTALYATSTIHNADGFHLQTHDEVSYFISGCCGKL